MVDAGRPLDITPERDRHWQQTAAGAVEGPRNPRLAAVRLPRRPLTFARRLLLAVLVALAAGPAATAAAAPPPRPILAGFEDEPSFLWSHDRFAMLERASAAHASLVRVIAEWHLVAPTRPK